MLRKSVKNGPGFHKLMTNRRVSALGVQYRMRAVRLLWNSVLLLLSLGAAPHIIYGRITNVTNGQQVPTSGVGHEYIGTIDEVVSPANGSLSIRIPLPAPPGRGLSLPLQFTYNSNGVIQVNPVTSNNDTRFLEQGGC